MADFLTPSPCDFSENRFLFNSSSKLAIESSKLSMDTLGQIAPLAALKDQSNTNTLPNGHLRSNSKNANNQSARRVSSSGQRSNHSSGDSSISSCGGSSVNSVFYRSKDTPGNEYVREPLKVMSNSGPQRLYPNGSAKSTDSASCISSKSKVTSEEVTYTITDELDDTSTQIVFLPPPPTDIDSDNDSVGGCEAGGPCSPRHHDWGSSRDLSKSPTSRRIHHGNNKCLCCMLLVFVLSTAGLTGVIVLMYLGKLQLAPIPSVRTFNEEGRARLGEGALTREVCESPSCLKTASSILSRMNASANPCDNFYNYACGGYVKEVDLSWFKTRIREFPDEIIHEHRKFIIDRLSTSFNANDDKLLASSKEIFRSCLFRSSVIDDRTRSVVTDIIEGLGGLVASPETTDLTLLLANVTRIYGASPFFKVIVHSDKNISLISQATQHLDPWTTGRDYSRSRQTSEQTDAGANMVRLSELLIQVIVPLVNESEARNIVSEFLRLEAHIRRILNTGRDHVDEDLSDSNRDSACDPPNSRRNMGELQIKYSGFGIDWITFFQSVIESTDISDFRLCKVKLSLELQHLLKITPKSALRQFIILHTLIHSDLFLLLGNGQQSIVQSADGSVVSETQEDQCLDILLHFLPALEKFSGCDEDTLFHNRGNAFSTLRNIRSALYNVLTSSLKVPKENAALVTNSSMKPVMESVSEELVTRCQSRAGPQGPFDEYSFNSNMLRIIQYYHGEYFRGRLPRPIKDTDLSALWISSSVQGNHRSRAGPIIYPSPVPHPIIYGSLGSFLASRVADGLGIEDLLDHHANGLLNHTVVLSLAVRLKCLAEMFSKMDILDYGTQVYKVDGDLTKGQQWKDQLALKLSFQRMTDDCQPHDRRCKTLGLPSSILGSDCSTEGVLLEHMPSATVLQLFMSWAILSVYFNVKFTHLILVLHHLILQAWKQSDNELETDHFIPGLTFTRSQMFFISFAQTHCEKVSERGILQYYVSEDTDTSIPGQQRVNGILQSSDDFSEAFQCSDNKYMNPMEKCRVFG